MLNNQLFLNGFFAVFTAPILMFKNIFRIDNNLSLNSIHSKLDELENALEVISSHNSMSLSYLKEVKKYIEDGFYYSAHAYLFLLKNSFPGENDNTVLSLIKEIGNELDTLRFEKSKNLHVEAFKLTLYYILKNKRDNPNVKVK